MAVASNDEAGVDAAVGWCIGHMEEGDRLSVWTSLQSNLSNCSKLEQLVNRHSNIDHVTGRGVTVVSATGPVLMAWPDMNDIGKLLRSARRLRALCVISWNPDAIRPWVTAAGPDVLGADEEWAILTPELDPVVIEAMKSMTVLINHNNTIAGGYEKDHIVSALLALHDAGVPMDGAVMQGWALANGWSSENPGRLAEYVTDINNGKRPRCRQVIRSDYVAILKEKVAAGGTAS